MTRLSMFSSIITMSLFISLFFLFALFVQLLWNSVMPKILSSVDPTFNETTSFTDIDYTTALGFYALIALVLFLVPSMKYERTKNYFKKSLSR